MENFWSSFFSNLFSGVVIAVLFGVFVSLRLEKLVNDQERKQNKIDEVILITQRSLDLVDAIKLHSSELHDKNKEWVTSFVNSGEKGDFVSPIWRNEIPRFDITFWIMYQNSGELPKFLSPKVVEKISVFYGNMVDARKYIDLFFEHFNGNAEEYVAGKTALNFALIIEQHLLNAFEEYELLPGILETESQILKNIISKLQSNKLTSKV